MKNHLLVLISIFLISCSNSDNDLKILLPTVSELDFSIEEYAKKSTVIGSINLQSDAKNYELSIKSQNPLNSFSINQDNGTILVNNVDAFDYDLNKIITGVINIKLNNEEKDININVNLLDDYRVYNKSITINNQSALDNFALNKYDEVNGDIVLSGSLISNLDKLYSLKSSYNIWIDNTEIRNLEGLRNLKTINQSPSAPANSFTGINIYGNNNLENVNGLRNLEYSGILTIELNGKLINLKGLETLKHCKVLNISTNESLTNIDGLNSLNEDMVQIDIFRNKNLININSLSNISSISNLFSVSNNEALKSINLPLLRSLGSLTIFSNKNLNDFCNLTAFFKENPNFTNYSISENAYNPTGQNIIEGNCSN